MAGTSAPASEEDVAAGLAAASRSREAVVIRGGGTRLELGAPARADRVIDLGGLSGVIEHHVTDLTVEAWAGTTVGALNRQLAPHRQLLALDPPLPDRATLGGVIAAGDPGFRAVPGSRPRDLLLGLSAVLADGTRIRSGGRVVKNVTGYELTKLFTGSLGTLGAITRVTLRLRALPEASRTVVADLPVSDSAHPFADRVLAAAAAAPGPAAVAVVPPGTGLPGLPDDGGFRLAIRFE
ncbi:MAG: FAD-binding oxidoreductase [Acidobacteria bacterium]|nr:FAD-binding oxidoreductase [Acidobacteriota bacterium]